MSKCLSAFFQININIFYTLTIKPNIATQVRNGTANIATYDTSIATDVDKINNNIATDHLSENKRIIDGIVRSKVKRRMSWGLIQECIIEACIVDHTIDELSALLNKTSDYLRNFIIPDMVADGTLLPWLTGC